MQIAIRISICKFHDIDMIVFDEKQKFQERKSWNCNEIKCTSLSFKMTQIYVKKNLSRD